MQEGREKQKMTTRNVFGLSVAIIVVACSGVRAQDDHDDGPEVWQLMTNLTARKCTFVVTSVVCRNAKKTHSISDPRFPAVCSCDVWLCHQVATCVDGLPPALARDQVGQRLFTAIRNCHECDGRS